MKFTPIYFVIFCASACLANPTPKDAPKCVESECTIENNCRCASINNPINNANDPSPQFVAITVSESIVGTLYNNYLDPLFFYRANPDGSPINLSFYVNHEYTDYELVKNLYLLGFEIGVHSITKNTDENYWRTASLQDLIDEFAGQKQILQRFANIPGEDIIGVRTPQLQLAGDRSFDAYIASDLSYDSSWPTMSTHPILPYTLDYLTTQECTITNQCVTEEHKGFWVAPITNIQGNYSRECNSLATCDYEGTPEEIADWLLGELQRVRSGNRAPLSLRLDSYWFEQSANSFEGFGLFMDKAIELGDVFFVSNQDVLEWFKNPVPASQYRTPLRDRDVICNPINCEYKKPDDGATRYMKSCIACPPVYPWKGNPLGQN